MSYEFAPPCGRTPRQLHDNSICMLAVPDGREKKIKKKLFVFQNNKLKTRTETFAREILKDIILCYARESSVIEKKKKTNNGSADRTMAPAGRVDTAGVLSGSRRGRSLPIFRTDVETAQKPRDLSREPLAGTFAAVKAVDTRPLNLHATVSRASFGRGLSVTVNRGRRRHERTPGIGARRRPPS